MRDDKKMNDTRNEMTMIRREEVNCGGNKGMNRRQLERRNMKVEQSKEVRGGSNGDACLCLTILKCVLY